MTAIFYNYDNDKNAFINPKDVIEKIPDFPEVCVTTFSEGIIKEIAADEKTRQIAVLYSANGELPVYEINYKGIRTAVYLSRVGAPACVAGMEEIIAMGAEKIVMFGSCGILDEKAGDGKIIIPVSAVRDEGTSYHYLPAGDEVYADEYTVQIFRNCLKEYKVPYTEGKTWTTDAIYRETPGLIKERKKQGCIAVEMECSAAMALAKFRNIPFVQFLYGADSLDGEQWEIRDLKDYGIRQSNKYMAIALECAVRLQQENCNTID